MRKLNFSAFKVFAYMKLYEVTQLMSGRKDTQTQHKPYSDAWKSEIVKREKDNVMNAVHLC